MHRIGFSDDEREANRFGRGGHPTQNSKPLSGTAAKTVHRKVFALFTHHRHQIKRRDPRGFSVLFNFVVGLEGER